MRARVVRTRLEPGWMIKGKFLVENAELQRREIVFFQRENIHPLYTRLNPNRVNGISKEREERRKRKKKYRLDSIHRLGTSFEPGL